MMRLVPQRRGVVPAQAAPRRRRSQTGICAAAMPSARPVTRPRCSSGKKRTRRFCASAQRNTAGAFDDVQTTPPRSPQNALSAAVELM